MTLSMPTTPAFTVVRFGLITNTQTFTSPLTKSTQRAVLAGAIWSAAYSLPKMPRAQAQPWKAFFLSLEGMGNTFYGYDPDCKQPLAGIQGAPLVNGANQTGTSLITDGWLNSKTVLKMGDYFTTGGELKMVTLNDVVSDGSGNATINFEPAIRTSPGDNTALTIQQASCTMMLQDDNQALWTCDEFGVYAPFTFAAMETFS